MAVRPAQQSVEPSARPRTGRFGPGSLWRGLVRLDRSDGSDALHNERRSARSVCIHASALLAVVLLCLALPFGAATAAQAGQAAGAQPPASDAADTGDIPEADIDVEIEVVGLTPIDGLGIARVDAPWTQHRLTFDELRAFGMDLTGALEQAIPGVHLSTVQGNPLQPDLAYRGFSTSPLLGASQELAVYQDGVRINEVFGDLVAWDLVPTFALDSVELAPGANPLFGLNTLGGALVLTTRTGFDGQRTEGALLGGSFGRRAGELSAGRAGERWALWAGARAWAEDGWRDFSPSESLQGLAKLSRRSKRAQWSLALDLGDSDLVGNGSVPVQLLELDREAVFTHPDRTENRLVFPRWRVDRQLGSTTGLAGVVYVRHNRITAFNADAFDVDFEDGAFGDDGAEYRAFDAGAVEGGAFGELGESATYAAQATAAAEAPVLDGVENRSSTDQEGWGFSLQVDRARPQSPRDTRWLSALTVAVGSAEFSSSSELATLTPTRTTVPSGVLLPGGSVGVGADTRRFGLMAAVHTSPSSRLAVTGQLSYNRSDLELNDRLGTELDGDHAYGRLLPSLGLAWQLRDAPRSSLTLFGGVARSARIPTPVEVTCADPEAPCRLPNAFVSDPPLDEVVTTSGELGLRGTVGRVHWNAAVFRGDSRDDIAFVSSGASTSQGYFRNVDATRRAGLELSASAVHRRLSWRSSYTLVEATFQDDLVLASPNHPHARDGELDVASGDRLPGVPRHQLRASIDTGLAARVGVGAGVRYDSSRFLRGDEANLLAPVPGFWLVDLSLRITLGRAVELRVALDNVLDAEIETFGTLGEADEVLDDDVLGVGGVDFEDPRFVTPGEPRSLTFMLRVGWDRAPRRPGP